MFQHGDFADGNVIADGNSFVAVDWELARADGFPLWDLLYLAVCALPLLDGALGEDVASREDEHVRYLNALFRGRAASSAAFFRWLRAMAAIRSGSRSAARCRAGSSRHQKKRAARRKVDQGESRPA